MRKLTREDKNLEIFLFDNTHQNIPDDISLLLRYKTATPKLAAFFMDGKTAIYEGPYCWRDVKEWISSLNMQDVQLLPKEEKIIPKEIIS